MSAHPTVLAIVQAGGNQLVDIALSNLVPSGITDVWLSVQFQAGSLHGHVAAGRPCDLDRTRGGLRWLMPEEGGGSAAQDGFSAGNADDLARSGPSPGVAAFCGDGGATAPPSGQNDMTRADGPEPGRRTRAGRGCP